MHLPARLQTHPGGVVRSMNGASKMQANNFSQLLEQLASSDQDAHRYRDNGSVAELTYGELIAEADQRARSMQRLGVRRGDRASSSAKRDASSSTAASGSPSSAPSARRRPPA